MDDCHNEEELVRALLIAHVDERTGRISPNAFEGKKASFSRQKVWSLEKILGLFRIKLGGERGRNLKGYAIAKVASLIAIARHHVTQEYKEGFQIRFLQVPEPDNPAHAEAHPKIPLGLSKKYVFDPETQVTLLSPGDPV